MNRAIRLLRAAAPIALLAVAASGCFNPFDPRISTGLGISTPKPVPNSPTAVMELFRWCYLNRAINEYREIFTADYVFQFGLADPFGNTYRDKPWTREDELASATNLFVGGSATEQPATSISLDFTNALRALPDTRAGKNSTWHKAISIDVLMTVKSPTAGDLEVKGTAVFFVVRGDSALIPDELHFQPDSTRWYIERWEDYTVQPGAAATPAPSGGAAIKRAADDAAISKPGALPTPIPMPISFGQLKWMYRS